MANFATFIAVFPKIASLKLSPPYKNSCLLAFSCSLWSWQQSIRIIKARRGGGVVRGGGSVVCMTQTQSFRYGIELCTGLCTVVCTALYTTIFEMLSAPLLEDLGLNFGGGSSHTKQKFPVLTKWAWALGTGHWWAKINLPPPPTAEKIGIIWVFPAVTNVCDQYRLETIDKMYSCKISANINRGV